LANKQYRLVDHHLVPVLKRSNKRKSRATLPFRVSTSAGAE